MQLGTVIRQCAPFVQLVVDQAARHLLRRQLWNGARHGSVLRADLTDLASTDHPFNHAQELRALHDGRTPNMTGSYEFATSTC
jgi:hypothetical protein